MLTYQEPWNYCHPRTRDSLPKPPHHHHTSICAPCLPPLPGWKTTSLYNVDATMSGNGLTHSCDSIPYSLWSNLKRYKIHRHVQVEYHFKVSAITSTTRRNITLWTKRTKYNVAGINHGIWADSFSWSSCMYLSTLSDLTIQGAKQLLHFLCPSISKLRWNWHTLVWPQERPIHHTCWLFHMHRRYDISYDVYSEY